MDMQRDKSQPEALRDQGDEIMAKADQARTEAFALLHRAERLSAAAVALWAKAEIIEALDEAKEKIR